MIVGSGITVTVTKDRKKPPTATPRSRLAVKKNNTSFDVTSPSLKKDELVGSYVGYVKQ
jgi:hypothetical protein